MNRYKLLAITLTVFLASCGGGSENSNSNTVPTPIPKPDKYEIKDLNNYVVAYKYQERYLSLINDCGNFDKPQYECSGITFRGIRPSAQPKPWIHREKDKNKGVISFAYIRQDLNFKLPESTYRGGIIISPDFEKNAPVLCASPMDLNTDSRTISNRCLASTELKYSNIDYTIRDCQDWGIDSAEKWLNIFIPIMKETKRKGSLDQFPGQTCSFSMANDNPYKVSKRAEYFKIFAEIRKNIPADLRPEWWNDEIVVNAWDDSNPLNAPIEAFYYNFGNIEGLKDAQSYQKQYYSDTKKLLPIIAIDFSTDSTAKFLFSTHDQIMLNEIMQSDAEKAKIISEWLINPPPVNGSDSLEFKSDEEAYQEALDKSVNRWNQAIDDADYTSTYLLKKFNKNININLNSPEILDLINYTLNLEQEIDGEMKKKYNRVRPFQYYNTQSCTPNQDNNLVNNGSYPSGHSLRGYLVANTLNDIFPNFKKPFDETAQEYAESRVICKAHWFSDTVAAEKMANITSNVLKYSTSYIEKLNLIKK